MLDQLDNHFDAQADRQRRYQAALISEEVRRLVRDRDRLVKPRPRHPGADDRRAAGTAGSVDTEGVRRFDRLSA